MEDYISSTTRERRQRKRREEARKEGFCVKCFKRKAIEGRTMCEPCRKIMNQKCRKSRNKKMNIFGDIIKIFQILAIVCPIWIAFCIIFANNESFILLVNKPIIVNIIQLWTGFCFLGSFTFPYTLLEDR